MRLSPGKILVAALAICAAVWPGALAKDVKKVISTGKKFAVLKPFDELMETFVRDNEIPGASLAVAKDGRLVYARGFGYADVEQQQQVQPE